MYTHEHYLSSGELYMYTCEPFPYACELYIHNVWNGVLLSDSTFSYLAFQSMRISWIDLPRVFED